MNETTEILVAGAGIGGLTAALTLHAKGIRSSSRARTR
jgi:2-polyprenyl-6-methoxyphenol hydroxylase-like FAD-dependent oxidoreductase